MIRTVIFHRARPYRFSPGPFDSPPISRLCFGSVLGASIDANSGSPDESAAPNRFADVILTKDRQQANDADIGRPAYDEILIYCQQIT